MSEKLQRSSRYITQAEVARELGISHSSVRELVLAGELKTAIWGQGKGRTRIIRESFEQFCRDAEAKASERFGRSA